MAVRKYRKLAILAKVETIYGTDAMPIGGADAVQMTNVTVTPIEGDEVSRDLMLPHLGASGIYLAGTYGKLEGEVEIAGAGAAGTVPAYGPLMRGCGLAEVISAGVSVVYSPVSAGEESVTIYWYADGVRHVLLGARGNLSMSFEPKKIPHWKFSVVGLLGTITAAALPTVDLTAYQKPILVSTAATALQLHGATRIAEKVDLDLGVKVEPRFLLGAETVEMTDRSASGTIVVEAQALTTVDWFAKALSRERGALSLVHGTTAGAIVDIAAPAVEIGKPTQGQTQGILNYTLPVVLCTDAGDDEITITVK